VRIYCAGPMRGLPSYGFHAFKVAREHLRDLGHEVVCPAEHDLANGFDPTLSIEEQDFDLDAAFAWDIAALAQVDAIALLPGWQDSEGCAIELERANALGLRILNVIL
jgi:hypothetical protein